VGSSRHSGGDRGDWQDQPQPWDDDPYSSQQSHQPSGPPWDDDSQWPHPPAPGRAQNDPHWPQAPAPGPAGGDARWAEPPPSWGNDAVCDDPRWAEPPAWADEAPAGDGGHWARTTDNGAADWDDRQYQAGPPGVDPYQAGADPYRAGPYGAATAPPSADPYQAGPYGAAAAPPGADPYRAGPYGAAAAPPGSDRYWDQPSGGTVPPDEDLYWARPSGTGAPPPDDDPYWGQPPGQGANWAADPQAWGAEGTIPVPPPWGSVTGEPAGPDDPTMHASVLSGPGRSPAGLDGIPPRRRRRFWVPLVAALVGVALIAAILIDTHRNSGSNSTAGSTPSANGSGSTGTTGIKQAPLSVANMFPQTKLDIAGLQFTQVAAATTTKCSTAAEGKFASALTSAGCKRVVRATYVDARKQYVVTAGVASLPTHAKAVSADEARQFGPDVWFTALNGPAKSGAGSASRTTGVGDDVVYRRFIVFALSTYANGQNPTGHTAQIKTLTGLSQAFSVEVEHQLASR
jgi:hypothetical protein